MGYPILHVSSSMLEDGCGWIGRDMLVVGVVMIREGLACARVLSQHEEVGAGAHGDDDTRSGNYPH